MDVTSHQIELGRQFAAALDARDYTRAAEFIAADCRYERTGQESLVGVHAICASYRECDERARRDFDSVVYRSEASAAECDGVRLAFFDELDYGGAMHTFRCSQIVYFGENQQIQRIELMEIPGERERLNAFCASHRIQLH